MIGRNKRNIVIGILCTLLVFMGVGYAALNQVLDINGTARSTNTWSIVIESITEKEKSLEGVVNKKATVGSDRISAEFEAEFTKPGDYITYEVVVKNEGTLPAKIDNINAELSNENTPQQEKLDAELFDIECDESIIDKPLPAGASETFTVIVRYKTEATRLPSGDVHAGIEIVAVQDTTGGSGNITPEPAGDDWLYKVNSEGVITGFNYNSSQAKKDENGYIINVPPRITKIVNGKEEYQNIVSIDENSFLPLPSLLISEEMTDAVIVDQENENILKQILNGFLNLMGMPEPTYHNVGDIDTSEFMPISINLDAYDGTITEESMNSLIVEPEVNISTLDLSGATNLTTIGDRAFSNFNLTTVNLGNTVTTIGSSAFSQNQISNLTIPNSVTTIGDSAFSYNQISSLTIGNSVTIIENYAFGWNQISSLTIPNSVTTIGDSAFSANQISSLTLGEGVTTIGTYAFENNPIETLSIGKCTTESCNYSSFGNSIKTLTIESGEIGDSAFWDNQISSLTLGDGVTQIGNSAFGSNQISSLTLGDGVTQIGDSAFLNNQISSLTLGNGVTTIGDYAFNSNQINILTIPNSVTTIGNSAFSANQISSLTLGEGVTTIENYAFGWNQISSLTIPNSVTTIGNSAFSANQISNLIIGSGVTSIGNAAFVAQFDDVVGDYISISITIKRAGVETAAEAEADFLANVSTGDWWYDSSLSPTITYLPS